MANLDRNQAWVIYCERSGLEWNNNEGWITRGGGTMFADPHYPIPINYLDSRPKWLRVCDLKDVPHVEDCWCDVCERDADEAEDCREWA